MSIIEQITYLYENKLPKCQIMLQHEEAINYFTRMIMHGNIIVYVKDNELLGFLEFFRINSEQFGRICCNISLSHDEDLFNGNICLITRMYIVPDLRNGETFINIGREFLDKNKTATHFAAMQFHKRHKPIQVYTREEILKHYKI